ncbi:MAG: two-component system response regulator [Planctomycetota bacterium]|nr:MAG: two-component system response regulator [Planctomycetota bacterium]
MSTQKIKILVVDDDKLFAKGLVRSLSLDNPWDIHVEHSGKDALNWLSNNNAHIAILDIMMPEMQGDELLEKIISSYPHIKCLMLTAHQDVDCAVRCIKNGAINYLSKPIEPDHLSSEIHRLAAQLNLEFENKVMKKVIMDSDDKIDDAFSEIITNDPGLKLIFHYVCSIAVTDRPMLICGETGTGKDLMAQAIHQISKRKGNYVTVNVAGLDDHLFSDALFGHTKGSYTGADSKRSGLLEEATDGTIFFDEFGDLEISSQIKLLRLLQNKEYHPIGSDIPKTTNARFIFATNQDIEKKMEDGSFRNDLYYRINSHKVDLPPLKKRKNDIALLVDHFNHQASILFKKEKPKISQEVYDLLSSYHFPGNIREIEGLLFDVIGTLDSDTITADQFQHKLKTSSREEEETKMIDLTEGETLPTLKASARMLINEALRRTDGNQSSAAKLLGITRQAMNSRLKSAQYDE